MVFFYHLTSNFSLLFWSFLTALQRQRMKSEEDALRKMIDRKKKKGNLSDADRESIAAMEAELAALRARQGVCDSMLATLLSNQKQVWSAMTAEQQRALDAMAAKLAKKKKSGGGSGENDDEEEENADRAEGGRDLVNEMLSAMTGQSIDALAAMDDAQLEALCKQAGIDFDLLKELEQLSRDDALRRLAQLRQRALQDAKLAERLAKNRNGRALEQLQRDIDGKRSMFDSLDALLRAFETASDRLQKARDRQRQAADRALAEQLANRKPAPPKFPPSLLFDQLVHRSRWVCENCERVNALTVKKCQDCTLPQDTSCLTITQILFAHSLVHVDCGCSAHHRHERFIPTEPAAPYSAFNFDEPDLVSAPVTPMQQQAQWSREQGRFAPNRFSQHWRDSVLMPTLKNCGFKVTRDNCTEFLSKLQLACRRYYKSDSKRVTALSTHSSSSCSACTGICTPSLETAHFHSMTSTLCGQTQTLTSPSPISRRTGTLNYCCYPSVLPHPTNPRSKLYLKMQMNCSQSQRSHLHPFSLCVSPGLVLSKRSFNPHISACTAFDYSVFQFCFLVLRTTLTTHVVELRSSSEGKTNQLGKVCNHSFQTMGLRRSELDCRNFNREL